MENYIPLIENSGYNTMISLIFKATNNVLNSMLEKNNNVLVHCSDGWDRTA
jgi:protein tyrosine/serine phosphatase